MKLKNVNSTDNPPLNQVARITKNMKKVDYQNDIWRKSYPRLERYLEDEPEIPKYNSFIRNRVIGGKYMIFDSMEDFGTSIQVVDNVYIKTKDMNMYCSWCDNENFHVISGNEGVEEVIIW